MVFLLSGLSLRCTPLLYVRLLFVPMTAISKIVNHSIPIEKGSSRNGGYPVRGIATIRKILQMVQDRITSLIYMASFSYQKVMTSKILLRSNTRLSRKLRDLRECLASFFAMKWFLAHVGSDVVVQRSCAHECA